VITDRDEQNAMAVCESHVFRRPPLALEEPPTFPSGRRHGYNRRMSEILFAVAGVAIAAFCIWLTARIINRRELWANRTAAALAVALVVYPLSFGPAVWLFVHVLPKSSLPVLHAVYAPFQPIFDHSQTFRNLAFRYQDFWVRQDELQKKVFGE
jgi:hypothetical protein